MEEDDWLEDDCDSDPTSIDSKSHAKIQSERETEGYRNGLNDGKEKTLQSGFNSGYTLAVNRAMTLAEIRGKLVAFLSFRMSRYYKKSNFQGLDSLSDEQVSEIEDLVETISATEKKMQEFKYDPRKMMAENFRVENEKQVENSGREVNCEDNSAGKFNRVSDLSYKHSVKSDEEKAFQQHSSKFDNKLHLNSSVENRKSQESGISGLSNALDNQKEAQVSSSVDAHHEKQQNVQNLADAGQSISQSAVSTAAKSSNVDSHISLHKSIDKNDSSTMNNEVEQELKADEMEEFITSVLGVDSLIEQGNVLLGKIGLMLQ